MLRLFTGDDQPASGGAPEAALLVSTYQKPRHLRLVLASVAMLDDVDDKLEVVIVDDGSTDETIHVVAQFAEMVDFPVRMTTHRHQDFQVARCRNEGVMASTAPYIIFLDGDCLVQPDFVSQHLRRRRKHTVMNGDCYRLDEDISAEIDEEVARTGAHLDWVSEAERIRIYKSHRHSQWNNLLRHRWKPNLIGNNIGLWRSDFELINGFDEDFVGWGVEDDDLGFRFRQAGLQIRSIRPWTPTFHVWHPRDTTWTQNWSDSPNATRYFRKGRETRCRNGLLKLAPAGGDGQGADTRDSETFDPIDSTRIIDFSNRPVAYPAVRQRRMLRQAA